MCKQRKYKFNFNPSAAADAERYRRYHEAKAKIPYRRYHEAKAKIPMDLPPQEFEERVKALARKYHI